MITSLENKDKIDYHSFAKNINIVDNYENTFLHYALINKNIKDIVNLVINSGINLNSKNNLGDTPLHIACYNLLDSLRNKDKNIYYHFEIIILLLNNGAKRFILNEKLFLPFDFLIHYIV